MFRVLSIDGGGIRGIIPALALTELERRTGRHVIELFDFGGRHVYRRHTRTGSDMSAQCSVSEARL
jgi:hypothetical protein